MFNISRVKDILSDLTSISNPRRENLHGKEDLAFGRILLKKGIEPEEKEYFILNRIAEKETKVISTELNELNTG